MGQVRIQALIALIGILLVGWVLSSQSVGFTYGTVPAAGGVYTEALIGQPQAFNPLLEAGNQVDRDVDRLVFSGLTTWDTTGRPVGDLAYGWFVSNDGLVYTFNLRDDVRWHDGERFDADDVLFTISLLRDPEFPGPPDLAAFWRTIAVERIDEYAIRFTLPEAFAPFLDYTAIGILPEHKLRGLAAADLPDNPFNRTPIGTGPYEVTRIGVTPAEGAGGEPAVAEVLLDAAPSYYGRAPMIHQMRFLLFPDADSALSGYEDGYVQGLSQLTPEQLPDALANSNLKLFSARLPRLSLIYLNLEKDRVPLFAEKQARQALLAALNRQWIIDHLLEGQAFVASSTILPGTWAYSDSLVPISYDPFHAGQLLTEAGWEVPADALPGTEAYMRANGNDLAAFTLLTPDDPTHLAIARRAAEYWAAIGVRVALDPQPANTVVERLSSHEYEAALVEIDFTRYPDPDPYPFWHQTQIENGQNYSSFNHREISQLVEFARITPDLESRSKLYRSFQARFADQTPALLLFFPAYSYAVDTRVQNVQLGPIVDPSDRFRNLADWYVVTRRVIVTPGVETTPGAEGAP